MKWLLSATSLGKCYHLQTNLLLRIVFTLKTQVNESTEVNEFMNMSQRCRSKLLPLFSCCMLKYLYSHCFPFTWRKQHDGNFFEVIVREVSLLFSHVV